jgi:serine/threonine-protein kinase
MPTHSFTLRELFDVAVDLPTEERGAVLDALCPDPGNRERLDRMLALDTQQRLALPRHAVEVLTRSMDDTEQPEPFAAGNRIGGFELIELIGEGGSSSVFRAVRETAGVRQEVALKLLRRALYSPDAKKQFRRERMALAQLQHPGIARLIEGGVTANGLAYIALDLVRGKPITIYAREHRLDLRQRLALFVQACRAVEAAHRALIVYRDLKPSNVLVGDDARVKLIDFGIAKLLDDDDTQTQMPSFTPAYASPEQRDGGFITTATDVYALGILLGELITGRRLNTAGTSVPSHEVPEHSNPGALPAPPDTVRRQLRGDLDNIVMKASAAVPDARYVSAGALADDIERLLEGRPVAARRPTHWYRASKFVSRHRGGVALTTIMVIALLSAFAVTLWQARAIRREAQRAEAVRDFLVQLFDTAKTHLPPNEQPTPQALVKAAAERAHSDDTIDAEVRADMLRTLGTVSLSMGDFKTAETLLENAIKRQIDNGMSQRSPEWIETMVQKGNLLQRTNRNSEADALMSGVLPELRRQESQPALSGLLLYAATRLYSGHADEAIAIAEEAAAKGVRLLPPETNEAFDVASFPGQIRVMARRYKEALPVLEPVIARWRASHQRTDDLAQAMNILADAKDMTGARTEADALHRDAIALGRTLYTGPHDRLASLLAEYAIFLSKQERYDEAQPLVEESLAIERQVVGAESFQAADRLDTLGMLQTARRHFEDAERSLRESVAIYAEHVATSGREGDLALVRSHLATVLVQRGKLDEARTLSETALAGLRAQYGENSDLVAGTHNIFARIALAQRDPAKALAETDQALAIIARASSPNQRTLSAALLVRARALLALNRYDEAWADANSSFEKIRKAYPDTHARQTETLLVRARIERAMGRTDDATATIAAARELGAPAALLSDDDNALLAGR